MLELQKFLQTNTPEELTAQLGIKAKPHPKFPELLHFSYDQIESPKNHPIVHECRGIILNSQDNWKVIAYPFNRFPNYGETWGNPIDWSTLRVQEKVDGSLMILWYYQGQWNVSTKGSPDAGGQVSDYPFTFSELFWDTFMSYVGDPARIRNEDIDPNFTYMLELTSIYNRVVCSYGKDSQLTFIGVRDISEYPYPEISISNYAGSSIPIVKEYPLTSVDEILKAAEALDPIQNEGFVALDANFNRCKIKSPSYVMIHHMKDGFGQRRMIRLIQLGEESEVLSYFPEYQDLFNEIKDLIDAKITEIETAWFQLHNITDRKEFAAKATKFKFANILFDLFQGKASNIRDYLLHSKKSVKMNGVPSEVFRYSEEHIENLIGLKTKPGLALGNE